MQFRLEVLRADGAGMGRSPRVRRLARRTLGREAAPAFLSSIEDVLPRCGRVGASRPRARCPPAHRLRAAGRLRGRPARARRRDPPRRARRGRAAPRPARLRRDRRDGRADERPTTTRSSPGSPTEKRAIAEAVRAGMPFWGVCLGVQLLASSLGARVYPGAEPEVGILPVELTEARPPDPVFAGLPRGAAHAPVARRHVRPARRRRAAGRLERLSRTRRSASARPPTACSSTSRSRQRWRASGPRCPAYADALERMLGPGALDRLDRRPSTPRLTRCSRHGRALFERWLEVSGAARARPAEVPAPPASARELLR